MTRIYLDHAASTPLRPQAQAAMLRFLTELGLMGNPSSAHAEGRQAREALDELRAKAASYFACDAAEVSVNSGGSEGDTHALVGVAEMFGRHIHLAISAIEHEAVVMAAKQLQRRGHRITRLPVTASGVVPLEAVEQLLRTDRPDLVSIMAVNNEIGTVQPVSEAAALCSEYGVLLHTDAVRAVGHGFEQLQQNPQIALLNCTAHKFGGPRGVGLLIQRRAHFKSAAPLPQLVCGGSQEHGSRAGTENLAGLAGLISALEMSTPEDNLRLEGLRSWLEQELTVRWPACQIHGAAASRATHITSVAFVGTRNREVQQALDARGIAVGTGSACHDEGGVVSPVLAAMDTPPKLAFATLRISLGWNTNQAQLEQLLAALDAVL